jgi:hypothetical protein
MSQPHQQPGSQPPHTPPPVVNWNPPPKEEIVETAIDDGITDPHKIAEWAKGRFNVDIPLDEIRKIKQAAEKRGKKST